MEKKEKPAHYSKTPLLQLAALCPQVGEERSTLAGQLCLELRGAIALAACPGFRSVLVPAITPRMGIFDCEQLKILLPIGSLFLQGRITETGLHPGCYAGRIESRLLHVVLVLVAGNRAFAERVAIDCVEKRLFLAGLHAGFDQITHRAKT